MTDDEHSASDEEVEVVEEVEEVTDLSNRYVLYYISFIRLYLRISVD